jgi:hypothetical protein
MRGMPSRTRRKVDKQRYNPLTIYSSAKFFTNACNPNIFSSQFLKKLLSQTLTEQPLILRRSNVDKKTKSVYFKNSLKL